MTFDKVISLWLAALAMIILPKAVFAESYFYQEVLAVRLLFAISSGSKLVFLAAATGFGFLVRSSFAPGNPARRGWTGIALGMSGFLAAQSYLAIYEIGQGITPYPSLGDVFFLAGQALLIMGSLSFLVIYGSLGLSLDRSSRFVWGVAGCGVFLLVALVLQPLARQSVPPAEMVLNLGYPLLDGFLIVLATGLYLQTRKMQGGGLWRTWRYLILGFLFTAAGDICFAFSNVFGFAFLDPFFDVLFACSYALLALGAHSQWKLQG